jgi:uncharacterized protein (TIGR02453 family)
MIKKDFFNFFYELSLNNNRNWFLEHKKDYETKVKEPFEHLVGEIILGLKEFVPGLNMEVKDAIFRINRDIRFSNDKTPYKIHMAAAFNPEGTKTAEMPGFYIQVGLNICEIGGGLYCPTKDDLIKVRKAMMDDEKKWHTLVEDEDFVDSFGGLQGEKNKVLQEPFKSAAKNNPDLYFKQFFFMREMDHEYFIDNENSAKAIVDHYKNGWNLVNFINNTLNP